MICCSIRKYINSKATTLVKKRKIFGLITQCGTYFDLAAPPGFLSEVNKIGILTLSFIAATIFLIVTMIYLKKVWRFKALFSEHLILSREKLKIISDGADLATWEWDIKTGKVEPDQRWLTMLGFKSASEINSFIKWKNSVHSDDRKLFLGSLRDHLKGNRQFFECEYRLRSKSDEWKWFLTRGRVTHRSRDEKPLRMVGIHFDISAKKGIENALRESERMSRNLVLNSPMGMHFYELMPDDRLVFIGYNPSADELLHVSNNKFVGKTIEEAFPPLATTEVPERYRRAALYAEQWTTESISYKDNAIVGAFEVRAFQTSPRKMVAVFMDITPRKKAEERLVKSEQQFRALVEASPDSILLTHTDGTIIFANEMASKICGEKNIESMLGKNGLSYLDSKEMDRARNNLKKLLNNQTVQNEPYNFIRADGTHFTGELSSSPIAEKNGEVTAIVSISRDISSRIATQEELRRSEERFRTLFDLAAVGVAQISIVTGNHARVNKKYASILDYSEDELLTTNFFSLVSSESTGKHEELYNQLKLGVIKEFCIEEKLVKKGGDTIWVNMTVSAMGNSFPGMVYFIVVLEDFTERKQKEHELYEKKAELERFVYLVSHDLKTPLVTVGTFLGFVEQDLTNKNFDDVTIDLLHIRKAVAKMGALLKDLLDLTRVGRLVNPSETFTLEEIVKEVLVLMQGVMVSRKITYTLHDTQFTIFGDRNRILEVFLNLIDNAIKYSNPDNELVLEIGTLIKDGEKFIYIKDNGIGINPIYHEKIFNLFDKLDAQSEGTGVGLTLVKRIVELHGGRIFVESEGDGKGSMFYFNLPQKSRNNVSVKKTTNS